jgi:hypothetical protein
VRERRCVLRQRTRALTMRLALASVWCCVGLKVVQWRGRGGLAFVMSAVCIALGAGQARTDTPAYTFTDLSSCCTDTSGNPLTSPTRGGSTTPAT